MVFILQTEALQFRLFSGNSRKGKKKQHTWNKCQKLTFAFLFITIYFADENAVVEMFLSSPKMMQEKCLLGVSELLEATFSIKNSCTDLTERMQEQNLEEWPTGATVPLSNQLQLWLACFMCSRSSWLIRGRVHVQNRRWLSRLEHIILLFFSPFIPCSRVQSYSVMLLALAACMVSTSSFTTFNSLILNLSSSVRTRFIFMFTNILIWLPFLTVGCVGWMDGRSCTHCTCSLALELASKFDVDKHNSLEGHLENEDLSKCDISGDTVAVINCNTGIISQPNFII